MCSDFFDFCSHKREPVLRNMNSDIKMVFDMTGFLSMFSIE